MVSNFYVAEDGSIHRNPVTASDNTESRTNTYTPAPMVENAQPRADYRLIHRVSEGRIVLFWIISIIISIIVASGVNQGLLSQTYGEFDGFVSAIGPFVVFAGALAGNILYGIFCADYVDYNLWAYILSALSSVGGIIVTVVAVALICVVVYLVLMVLAFIIAVGVVIAIICGILGGS